MSKYIICLCEGEVTEPLILDNLTPHFLKESTIQVVYGTVIYALYKELLKDDGTIDEYLDFFQILKEKYPKSLKDISKNNVARIFLFFDYDSHASNASDDKLQVLLETFNNETENGKLYVSYPMVEALRHVKNGVDFESLLAEPNKQYKKESHNCDEQFKHFNDYTKDIWLELISNHCKKANSIIGNSFTLPNNIIEQLLIFKKQTEHKEKVAVLSAFPLFLFTFLNNIIKQLSRFKKQKAYKKQIEHKEKVAVLSAFPLFLLDYYGAEKLKSIIEKK